MSVRAVFNGGCHRDQSPTIQAADSEPSNRGKIGLEVVRLSAPSAASRYRRADVVLVVAWGVDETPVKQEHLQRPPMPEVHAPQCLVKQDSLTVTVHLLTRHPVSARTETHTP